MTTPIIAPPSFDATRAAAFVLQRPHGSYDARTVAAIADQYWGICVGVGVDPGVAWAQAIHETGAFSSFWAQPPRFNFAGLGVTGQAGAGLVFPSWYEGVAAHVGRLVAYATKPGQRAPAQQALAAYALAWRALPTKYQGAAPNAEDLGGKWAVPGVGYGEKIAAIMERVRG